MTVGENIKVDAFLIAEMRSRESSWLQYPGGLIDHDQWNTELAVIRYILSSPRARLWWTRRGRAIVSAEFASFVDDVVKTLLDSNGYSIATNWSNP